MKKFSENLGTALFIIIGMLFLFIYMFISKFNTISIILFLTIVGIISISFIILYLKQKKAKAFLQQVELIDSYNRPRQMASSYEYVSPDTIHETQNSSNDITEEIVPESSESTKQDVTLEDLELRDELLERIEAHEMSMKKEVIKKEQDLKSSSADLINIQEEIDFIKSSKKKPEIPIKEEELNLKIFEPIPKELTDTDEDKNLSKKSDSSNNEQ